MIIGGDDFCWWPLSGILNALGVPPYGSLRDRPFGGKWFAYSTSKVAGSGADMDSSIRPRMRPQSDMPDMRMPANAAYMSPLEPFGGGVRCFNFSFPGYDGT